MASTTAGGLCPRLATAIGGGEVEEAIAVHVPHVHALGAFPEHGGNSSLTNVIVPRLVASQLGGEPAGFRAGNFGAKLGEHLRARCKPRRARRDA